MRLKSLLAVSLWPLAVCLLLTSAAQAHKLLVAAVVEGKNAVKVQAFFPDGNPAQEIPVTVTPKDGSPPLTGTTDVQGICRFTGVKPGAYGVAAGDPLGHRGETNVVIPGGASSVAPQKPEKPAQGAGAGKSPPSLPQGEPLPWGNILAGLGFIFGLASFVMVLKLRADMRRYASRN